MRKIFSLPVFIVFAIIAYLGYIYIASNNNVDLPSNKESCNELRDMYADLQSRYNDIKSQHASPKAECDGELDSLTQLKEEQKIMTQEFQSKLSVLEEEKQKYQNLALAREKDLNESRSQMTDLIDRLNVNTEKNKSQEAEIAALRSVTASHKAKEQELETGLGTLREQTITAGEPERVLAIAKSFGYAELKNVPGQRPVIFGWIDGVQYHIFFSNCGEGPHCQKITFLTMWRADKLSYEKVVKAGESVSAVKASTNNFGDLILEMPVNMHHGVSKENLEVSFQWWSDALQYFRSLL